MNRLARNVSLSVAFILGLIVGLDLTYQNSYAIPQPMYSIKVTFDSITVHNDHDPFGRGSGEWIMAAYVQGKKVGIQDMEPDDGDTINFEPGTETTVELTGTTPLAIYAWGYEMDGLLTSPADFCSAQRFVTDDLPIFHDPGLDWEAEIKNYISVRLEEIDICPTNRLGRLIVFYDPTAYGAGSHEEKSVSGDFTLRYTISVSKTANIPPLAPQPLERVCNNNLPITSVTASGNEVGNVPQNVLDNNLGTRWSSDGVGQFITGGLASTKNICSVDIAWYRGDERVYNFVIATSSDGSTFTDVLTKQSSGTTLDSEKYTIPPTDARYVRVTVNGNTVNNFASITELDLFDYF